MTSDSHAAASVSRSSKSAPNAGPIQDRGVPSERLARTGIRESRVDRPTNHAPAAVEAAAWMIREVAHDVRSPLAGIQESIRLVRDGDVGSINVDQRELLSAAADQCQMIDHMIDEMSDMTADPIPRMRSHRQWESVQSIAQSIQQATRAITRVRGVGLRTDIQVESDLQIFVDRVALIRLISNLVVNSIRSSVEHQTVCLRIERIANENEILWTVVDHGTGISQEELGQISERGVSAFQSTGLGLSICRRLASMSHTPLKIRSRLGGGTEVSMVTPEGGPASVAAAFARWRLQIRGPVLRPQRRDTLEPLNRETSVRVDRADGAPLSEIVLGPEWDRPRVEERIVVGTATIGAMVPQHELNSVDEALQRSVGPFELMVPTGPRRYLFAFDIRPMEIADRIDQVESDTVRRVPGARIQWSETMDVPVDQHRLVTRMKDFVICQSLSTNQTKGMVADRDAVRPGTPGLSESPIAAARLDEEIRRLGRRMKSRSNQLRESAKRFSH